MSNRGAAALLFPRKQSVSSPRPAQVRLLVTRSTFPSFCSPGTRAAAARRFRFRWQIWLGLKRALRNFHFGGSLPPSLGGFPVSLDRSKLLSHKAKWSVDGRKVAELS